MITHAMEGFAAEKVANYQELKGFFCSSWSVREIVWPDTKGEMIQKYAANYLRGEYEHKLINRNTNDFYANAA